MKVHGPFAMAATRTYCELKPSPESVKKPCGAVLKGLLLLALLGGTISDWTSAQLEPSDDEKIP